MPIVTSEFRPAWWLPGPHAQTLYPHLLRPRPRVATTPERLEMPDGDFVDLAWTAGGEADAPLVVVLHGLEGSLDSQYARGILRALVRSGLRAVFMHFRGCSGTPNRLPRGYHSGDTADLAHLIAVIREREPDTPLAGLGYSLGGNVLLKWLGETGGDNPLSAAAAVSVPYRLDIAAERMARGGSRLYQWRLVSDLRRTVRCKADFMDLPLDLDRVRRARTFTEFDEHATAPLHGFDGAYDYYDRASSRQYLAGIRVPTLALHALDDPFMTPDAVPTEAELSPAMRLELSASGGHVGFVAGDVPLRPRFWLEERLPDWFAEQFGLGDIPLPEAS